MTELTGYVDVAFGAHEATSVVLLTRGRGERREESGTGGGGKREEGKGSGSGRGGGKGEGKGGGKGRRMILPVMKGQMIVLHLVKFIGDTNRQKKKIDR